MTISVTRTSSISKLIAFIFVFISCGASEISQSLFTQLVFILVGFVFVLLGFSKVFNDRWTWRIALVLLAYFILHSILFGEVVLGELKYLFRIFVIYLLIKALGERLLIEIYRVIYWLSLVSLPLYLWQLLDYNSLHSVGSLFNIANESQRGEGGVNLIIFHLNPWHPARNSGFAWEPGTFGAFIMIALLLRIKYFKNQGLRTSVYMSLIALTTFSTTTYLALAIYWLFVLLTSDTKMIFKTSIMLLVVPTVIYLYLNTAFLGEKLSTYYGSNIDYKEILLFHDRTDKQSIGRFAGLLIEWERLKESPWIGSGWHANYESMVNEASWSNPNGLSVVAGRFGMSGIGLMLICLHWFTRAYYASQLSRLNFLQILIILMLMFSNPFHDNIVVICIVMAGVYLKESQSRRIEGINSVGLGERRVSQIK